MLKTIKKNSYYLYALSCLLVLTSCDAKRVFDDYATLKNGSWNINNTITFPFTINDTLAKRNVFINIRNNNDYGYSNLFLITKLNFPDGHHIIDTLEYDMADKTGRFLGHGFSEIKENKLFYKEHIIFPISGNYSVDISHAMRKNGSVNGIEQLNGITDLGFRIENIE